jgi:hypothetical protein
MTQASFASEGVRWKMERLGEDRFGRPWFWPQHIQCYERMHLLLGRVRYACEGPDSQNDRQFVTPFHRYAPSASLRRRKFLAMIDLNLITTGGSTRC